MTKTETGTKTPPRHNYAAQHTPIASVKRPRSSLSERRLTPTRNSSLTPTRRTSSDNDANATLSPLHPPKAVHREETETVIEENSWVGRKVDAFFSPVLNFLQSHEEQQDAVMTEPTDEDEEPQQEGMLPRKVTASDSDTAPTAIVKESSYEEEDDDEVGSDVGSEHNEEASLQGVAETITEDDEFNPWQFIKSLPKYDLVKHLCPSIALPAKDPAHPPLTLVLDLDETLVHCTVEEIECPHLQFPVQFHGVDYQVYVRLRPHLQTFLDRIRDQYEVIVFTASQKVYANELLNRIDPDNKYFHHRLFRESCLAVEGNFLKDLNVLGRDLSKTVLVDNSPHAFGYQIDNGIPIESWFDDESDRELLKLERFLRQLKNSNDVRETCREKFGCTELVKAAPEYTMG